MHSHRDNTDSLGRSSVLFTNVKTILSTIQHNFGISSFLNISEPEKMEGAYLVMSQAIGRATHDLPLLSLG